MGRAIAERLAADGAVVVLDVTDELDWCHDRVQLVSGDAGDPAISGRAAAAAEAAGPLTGWVNNAAIFRDAGFESATATEIRDLIMANLALAGNGLPHRRPPLPHRAPAGCNRQRVLPPGSATSPRCSALPDRQKLASRG